VQCYHTSTFLQEPDIPPPEHVSQKVQDEEKKKADQHGSSPSGEVPSAPTSSASAEAGGASAKAKPEPKKLTYYGYDITGNEEDSILRRLQECHEYPDCEHWAGFYNHGFPAYAPQRHMFWHKQWRVHEDHKDAWFTPTEDQMMATYIYLYKNLKVEDELEDIRKLARYNCSDPRMSLRQRRNVQRLSKLAETKWREDWDKIDEALQDYIEINEKIPYISIHKVLAASFLGASFVDPEERDDEHPFRKSK
jgi:hypothetical protein